MEKPKLSLYRTTLYKPFVITKVATRPGCLTVLQYPSRMGKTLYYPDGRVVHE